MAADLQLPALKHLGDLADSKPTIVIDTREILPLLFERLPSVRGTLMTADYSIAGMLDLFAVERKTACGDLISCCMGTERQRFERELHRLRGFRFKRLLIVGTEEEILAHRYMSAISPKSVMGSLYAWQARYDLPFVFAATPEKAAREIELWAHYFATEIVKAANSLLRGCEEAALPAENP